MWSFKRQWGKHYPEQLKNEKKDMGNICSLNRRTSNGFSMV
jgi:hypothetical protein